MGCEVVVIEDEEAICFALKVILSRRDIGVETAYTGREGLKLARRERPAIVVVDVRLPDMDGWDICRELKRGEDGWVPTVVFLTAAAQESDRRKAAEAGGDAFIAKPFEMSRLVAQIRNLLEERHRAEPHSTP